MTVTTTSSKVVCLGNGSTTVFAFPFLIPASGQEQVIFTDASGNQTTLVPSQYTVTGFNNPAGGTVTYPLLGPAIASGTTLTIARVLPIVQSTSISNQGAFYPQAVESALDYATMSIQQIAQGQAQSLKGPIVDSVALGPLPAAAQRANQLLGFDSTGQPIASQPASAQVSSVMQPVVNASTIAIAVGLLGIPIFVGAGTSTGSANAQVISATAPGTFALVAGNKLSFIPGFTNNSAMTLTVNGLTTKNVYKRANTGPVALVGGEVVAGQIANVTYDGTQFILDELGILTNPTLYMKNSATPTPTATGDIQWDTTNKGIVVGDGSTQRYFPSLPALTTIGDMLYMSAAKIMSRLGIGTAGQVLQVNTGATAPQWATIPFIKLFESAPQTITSGGTLTIAHGLGVQPKLYEIVLQCVTAEGGYVAGEETITFSGGQSNQGLSLRANATNMIVVVGSSGIIVVNTSGTTFVITNSRWNIVVRAWA